MAKRRRKRQDDSEAEVEAAIRQIREAHAAGREITDRIGRKSIYGKDQVGKIARERGVNEDVVRKLRQFADPEAGYTAEELDELCELCRQNRRVLGITFIARLLSIPKAGGQRSRFQRQVLREGFSRARMEMEIRARYGKRKQGGNRPAVAETVIGVLSQIDGLCTQWERLQQRIADPEEYDGEMTLREQLPPKVRGMLTAVDAVMAQLQHSVGEELERSRTK